VYAVVLDEAGGCNGLNIRLFSLSVDLFLYNRYRVSGEHYIRGTISANNRGLMDRRLGARLSWGCVSTAAILVWGTETCYFLGKDIRIGKMNRSDILKRLEEHRDVKYGFGVRRLGIFGS
jgi:hypothetical protein